MPYTKQDLQTLYSLSPEDVELTLTAAKIPQDKETYTDEEIQSGFEMIRSYFNSGQVSDYTVAAELFNQQQSSSQQLDTLPITATRKAGKGKKSSNSNENGAAEEKHLDISELLARASEKCGTRIKLSEATEILASCGLPDTEEYTLAECDRFSSACDLIKNQGKSPKEVAAQFGIAATFQTGAKQDATAHNGSVAQTTAGENQDAAALIQEVNELLSQASSIQMQQIREMLPQLAVEQLQEIKTLFWQMTAQRLRQHMESGELEASIRTASSKILNGSGNGFGLLSQSQISSHNPRSLPGSSMNASTSE